MDPKHREAIKKNLPNLIKLQNFPELCKELVHSGVYTLTMLEDVLVGSGSTVVTVKASVDPCLAQRLFINILTRGPDAFHHFVEALKSADNKELANELLLELDTAVTENSEIALPEDEVDWSQPHRSLPTSQTILLKKPIEIGIVQLLPSTILTEVTSVIECEPENSGVHGNSIYVTFSSQLRHSTTNVVKPASVLYNGFANEGECYHMKSNPRGFALILNNIDFLGDPDAKRLGAENDSDNLTSLLEQMGYEVNVHTNVRKQELLDRESGTLENFLKKFTSNNVDSCIVSINSHGFDRDWIRMSDPPGRDEKSTAIDLIEDIFPRFNNRNFPAFQGKPKIFLINACRGRNFNRVVRSPVQNTCRTQYDGLPTLRIGSEFSDFLILRSTVPEYVSMRDLDKGTWFVQCICRAFSQHAVDQEFHGLKRKVNELMEELIDEENRIKQSCHYEEFGTNKLLYFNPGL